MRWQNERAPPHPAPDLGASRIDRPRRYGLAGWGRVDLHGLPQGVGEPFMMERDAEAADMARADELDLALLRD